VSSNPFRKTFFHLLCDIWGFFKARKLKQLTLNATLCKKDLMTQGFEPSSLTQNTNKGDYVIRFMNRIPSDFFSLASGRTD
jgi:hypothetical protein